MTTRRERAMEVAKTLTAQSERQHYCVTEEQVAEVIESFADAEAASEREACADVIVKAMVGGLSPRSVAFVLLERSWDAIRARAATKPTNEVEK